MDNNTYNLMMQLIEGHVKELEKLVSNYFLNK